MDVAALPRPFSLPSSRQRSGPSTSRTAIASPGIPFLRHVSACVVHAPARAAGGQRFLRKRHGRRSALLELGDEHARTQHDRDESLLRPITQVA
jgi:hypothetical protein